MPDLHIRVVDVYPYRLRSEGAEFLLLRRADDAIYAGTWRMVGGKIEPGEKAWAAALRELKEETQRVPVRFWTVPSVNTFYEWDADRVNLVPAFAAEIDADPVLDREHDAFGWYPASEAVARLAWPEQRRLLRLIDELVPGDLPASWVIEVPTEPPATGGPG